MEEIHLFIQHTEEAPTVWGLQNDMDKLCQWAEAHAQIQKTGMDLILSVRVWSIRPL